MAETPWLVGKRSGIRWVPVLKWQEASNKMKKFGRLHNLGVKRGSKTSSKASATGVVGQARLVLRACLHRKWTGYIEIMILQELGWSIS